MSESNPAIVKDAQLCVECGHCLAVCQEEIGVAGRRMVPPGGETAQSCINCGQCSASCPEQSRQVKSEVELVKAAIRDPEKVVVFSTSPSVRVGLGDAFTDKPGTYVEGKMVAALKALGPIMCLTLRFPRI